MRRVALLAVLVPTLLLASSPAPSAALPSPCGHTQGGRMIFAKRVTCSKARRIVRRWARAFRATESSTQLVLGFSCHGKEDPYAHLAVVCRRGRRYVSFATDVPGRRAD